MSNEIKLPMPPQAITEIANRSVFKDKVIIRIALTILAGIALTSLVTSAFFRASKTDFGMIGVLCMVFVYLVATVAGELYSFENRRIWLASRMMHIYEVLDYMVRNYNRTYTVYSGRSDTFGMTFEEADIVILGLIHEFTEHMARMPELKDRHDIDMANKATRELQVKILRDTMDFPV